MKQKVLLVEHSQPVQTLIKSRLSEEPLEISIACNSDEALKMTDEVKPDLILIDADLPKAAGLDLCRQLKADVAIMHIPVIFLISAASASQKLDGLEVGAVDFIAKPFDPAELRARIRAALRTKFLMDLLASKAMVDGLTGLWNRTYLEQRTIAEMATVNRTGRSFACVVADVDSFKSYNEKYGHPFGDELLRTIAIMFVEDCRTEDIVCRCGADRFVILTPGVDVHGAAALAERLRQTVEKIAVPHGNQKISATCSFGVAGAGPRSTASPLPAAEQALAIARSAGGNQVECDDFRRYGPRRRIALMSDCRIAKHSRMAVKVAFVEAREIAKVFDDLLNPPQAFPIRMQQRLERFDSEDPSRQRRPP